MAVRHLKEFMRECEELKAQGYDMRLIELFHYDDSERLSIIKIPAATLMDTYVILSAVHERWEFVDTTIIGHDRERIVFLLGQFARLLKPTGANLEWQDADKYLGEDIQGMGYDLRPAEMVSWDQASSLMTVRLPQFTLLDTGSILGDIDDAWCSDDVSLLGHSQKRINNLARQYRLASGCPA